MQRSNKIRCTSPVRAGNSRSHQGTGKTEANMRGPAANRKGVGRRPTGRAHRRRRCRIVWKRFGPFLLFAAMGIVSIALLIDYGVHSLQRRQENDELSREYSEAFQQSGESAAAEATMEPQPAATEEAQPMLRAAYRTMSGEPIEKIQKLYEQNNDLVGWLYIRGVVDLPVVYRDNEYYLDHNFKKRSDKGGALFLDENHPLTEATQNLVIHGHNMYDSSMFGILSSYEQLAVMKNHAFASFSTLYAPEDYVVCAVLRVSPDVNSDQYFNYIGKPVFQDEEAFYSYIGEIKERSLFEIPIDVLPSDSILTLATCVDNDRLAVIFRSLRAGETKEQLQRLVDQAYKKQK